MRKLLTILFLLVEMTISVYSSDFIYNGMHFDIVPGTGLSMAVSSGSGITYSCEVEVVAETSSNGYPVYQIDECKIPADFYVDYAPGIKYHCNVTKIGQLGLANYFISKKLYIPSSITSYSFGSFMPLMYLEEVHIECPTPPIGDETTQYMIVMFRDEIYSQATLYVPKGSIPAYRAAKHWMNFVNIVEEGDETGIDYIHADERTDCKPKIFDLNGRQVTNPGKGIYVINGKKVVLK